jgi:hypothetical protein
VIWCWSDADAGTDRALQPAKSSGRAASDQRFGILILVLSQIDSTPCNFSYHRPNEPNKNGFQISASDIHGRGRHDALRTDWVLPEDYAAIFAVALGISLFERLLRSCVGHAASRPSVFTFSRLGHYCFVDRRLPGKHLRLSASGIAAGIADVASSPTAAARRFHRLGVLAHTTKGSRHERVTTLMIRSLCEACSHKKEVVSANGSRFLLCQLSQKDRRFQKYPPQPVIKCSGFVEVTSNDLQTRPDEDVQ